MFDVGANVGSYANILLQQKPKTIVHCFEPGLEAYDELKSKFEEKKNVVCNNIALSDTEGEKTFYNNNESTTYSSFYKMKGSKQSVEVCTVKSTTLDNYCKQNLIDKIDLIKIDTEGHELAIIKGGRNLFEKGAVEIVQFEYGHAAQSARVFFYDLIEFFSSYGYIVYKLKPSGWELVLYSPWMEGCPYANFFAIKNESVFMPEIKKHEIIHINN